VSGWTDCRGPHEFDLPRESASREFGEEAFDGVEPGRRGRRELTGPDNSGALFKNEDRVTDNQPNARGRAKINGVNYFVAAWTKVSQSGVRYQSLAFTEAPKPEAGKPSDVQDRPALFDDDIPF
jgi:hypothetical protein